MRGAAAWIESARLKEASSSGVVRKPSSRTARRKVEYSAASVEALRNSPEAMRSRRG